MIAGFQDDVIKSWTETKAQGGKEPKKEVTSQQESKAKTTENSQSVGKKKEAAKTSIVFEVKVDISLLLSEELLK